jgi:hypothetical protein
MSDNNNLTKEQKIGFLFLFVFSILIVGLGFMQMKRNIYGPFALTLSAEGDLKNSFDYDENTRLKQIDTDQDGLSDYDEIYIYNTSPYLEDTDSDGILDKVEIDMGEDPLCPIGVDCSTGSSIINDTSAEWKDSNVELNPLGDDVITSPAEILVSSQLGEGNENGINIAEILDDPVALRSLLLSTGQISEEDLAKIDDETLLLVAEKLATEEYDLLNDNIE